MKTSQHFHSQKHFKLAERINWPNIQYNRHQIQENGERDVNSKVKTEKNDNSALLFNLDDQAMILKSMFEKFVLFQKNFNIPKINNFECIDCQKDSKANIKRIETKIIRQPFKAMHLIRDRGVYTPQISNHKTINFGKYYFNIVKNKSDEMELKNNSRMSHNLFKFEKNPLLHNNSKENVQCLNLKGQPHTKFLQAKNFKIAKLSSRKVISYEENEKRSNKEIRSYECKNNALVNGKPEIETLKNKTQRKINFTYETIQDEKVNENIASKYQHVSKTHKIYSKGEIIEEECGINENYIPQYGTEGYRGNTVLHENNSKDDEKIYFQADGLGIKPELDTRTKTLITLTLMKLLLDESTATPNENEKTKNIFHSTDNGSFIEKSYNNKLLFDRHGINKLRTSEVLKIDKFTGQENKNDGLISLLQSRNMKFSQSINNPHINKNTCIEVAIPGLSNGKFASKNVLSSHRIIQSNNLTQILSRRLSNIISNKSCFKRSMFPALGNIPIAEYAIDDRRFGKNHTIFKTPLIHITPKTPIVLGILINDASNLLSVKDIFLSIQVMAPSELIMKAVQVNESTDEIPNGRYCLEKLSIKRKIEKAITIPVTWKDREEIFSSIPPNTSNMRKTKNNISSFGSMKIWNYSILNRENKTLELVNKATNYAINSSPKIKSIMEKGESVDSVKKELTKNKTKTVSENNVVSTKSCPGDENISGITEINGLLKVGNLQELPFKTIDYIINVVNNIEENKKKVISTPESVELFSKPFITRMEEDFKVITEEKEFSNLIINPKTMKLGDHNFQLDIRHMAPNGSRKQKPYNNYGRTKTNNEKWITFTDRSLLFASFKNNLFKLSETLKALSETIERQKNLILKKRILSTDQSKSTFFSKDITF